MLTTMHAAPYFNSALGTVANTDCPALADGVLTISNGHFRLTDQMNLVGAANLSATAIRARIDSPTIRIPGNPYILPVNVSVTPVDRHKLLDLSANPYALPIREEIAVQQTAAPATTEPAFAILWFQSNKYMQPPGRVQWVRLTSATTVTAQKLTTLTLTFDQSLPTGYWSVVGSEHFSATGILHRFIFPGSFYRPGFLSRTAEGNMSYFWNYNGALGELGRFVNDNPFQMEVLCNAADAAHVVYVGLVPVGSL